MPMLTICDTNILLFWADQPDRLSSSAHQALDNGMTQGNLACAAISFWEIAMLFRKNRLSLPTGSSPVSYMDDIIESLNLKVLQLTPAIAALAEGGIVAQGDPGDRLIAATAIIHQSPLITADEKLRANPGLQSIW